MTNLLTFFCVSTPRSGRMSIPQSTTGYEPKSELDVAGGSDPLVDSTQDDEDGKSLMSDIPLQLPASASVASHHSALITFSQAEGDLMRNARSLHPFPSETRGIPWQSQYPITHPQRSPADLKKLFHWLHNVRVKL